MIDCSLRVAPPLLAKKGELRSTSRGEGADGPMQKIETEARSMTEEE